MLLDDGLQAQQRVVYDIEGLIAHDASPFVPRCRTVVQIFACTIEDRFEGVNCRLVGIFHLGVLLLGFPDILAKGTPRDIRQ